MFRREDLHLVHLVRCRVMRDVVVHRSRRCRDVRVRDVVVDVDRWTGTTHPPSRGVVVNDVRSMTLRCPPVCFRLTICTFLYEC